MFKNCTKCCVGAIPSGICPINSPVNPHPPEYPSIHQRSLHVHLLSRRLVRPPKVHIPVYADGLALLVAQLGVELHLVHGGQVNAVQAQSRHAVQFRVAHQQRPQALPPAVLRHHDTLYEATVGLGADGRKFDVRQHNQVVLQQQETGGQDLRGGSQLRQSCAHTPRPL